MDNKTFSFEHLEVWMASRELVKNVYQLLDSFPVYERRGLCDQIRRAVISISSNIAEGSGRSSAREKVHFIEIAYGSLMEVYCQLQIATDLNYIQGEQFSKLKPSFHAISKMLTGLRAFFRKTLPH